MSLVDHRIVDRLELGGVEIAFQIDLSFVSKAVEGATESFRQSVFDEFATAIPGVVATDVDPGMSPSRDSARGVMFPSSFISSTIRSSAGDRIHFAG